MKPKSWFVLLLAIGLALTGCIRDAPHTVMYEIEAAQLEITVPGTWDAIALSSLLAGVRFVDRELGGAVTSWVLYGDATGRSPDQQLGDLQAIMSIILEDDAMITAWSQDASSSFTAGGRPARRVEAQFYLDGRPMECVAVAVAGQGLDIMMIGQATAALWEDMEEAFDEAFASLTLL